MKDTVELKEKRTDRELTVSLKGELDHHAATVSMAALERSVERALPLRLILDFSGVTFMDSSGIALVLRINRRMREMGGSIRLQGVPQQAKKVFEAAHITRLVPME